VPPLRRDRIRLYNSLATATDRAPAAADAAAPEPGPVAVAKSRRRLSRTFRLLVVKDDVEQVERDQQRLELAGLVQPAQRVDERRSVRDDRRLQTLLATYELVLTHQRRSQSASKSSLCPLSCSTSSRSRCSFVSASRTRPSAMIRAASSSRLRLASSSASL